ncbi:MAG: flippase-like domain-containing protein [Paramuribaculum sp.]|nr:flippase-like domain-containing protein [Paramuribaculum sp.]
MTTTSSSTSSSSSSPSSASGRDTRSLFRRVLADVVQYLLPAACSALLVVWLFHKIHFQSMMHVVRNGGVRYEFLILMMCVTTLSHVVRGARWGLQIEGVGARCGLMQLSVSIFGCYALNLLFPRAGEVWRCVYISRTHRVPLSTVVGTLVGDRASDIIVVFLLTGLAFIVAAPELHKFMTHYAVGRDFVHLVDNPWLWIGVVMLVSGSYFLLHCFRTAALVQRIDGSLRNLWNGFHSLFTTMPHKGLYLVLTLGIWICYFLQTYLAFFAFPFTRELIHTPGTCFGLIPGLVAFVFGSFSMAVPSNGGLGAWNLAVIFALTLFGIGKVEAAAFSMVMWSFESLMLVILGIFTCIYVTTTRGEYRDAGTPGSPAAGASPK